MSWEMIFICLLIVAAIISFVVEKIPPDITALSIFGCLLGVSIASQSQHLPTVDEYLKVFASPAPVTIAAMFIISAALEQCGAIETIAQKLEGLSCIGYKKFMFILLTIVAFFSAFMNNTAIVVVLLPVVLSLARKSGHPASKFLIPLSYGSIFGGCCTAIGTSTNILMSGILVSHHMEPLTMFELAPIGLPLFLVGTLYLTFFGNRLLPKRETLTSILSEEERKEYITEAYIKPDSTLVGQHFSKSDFFKAKGIRLIEVVRQGIAIESQLETLRLEAGDRLVLACRPTAIMQARSIEGVHFSGEMGPGLEKIASDEGSIVEGVIGPTSSLVGQNLRETHFRQHFRMILIAVHRKGANLREKLHSLRFEFGDTLLMMGSDKAIECLRKSKDIILLDQSRLPALNMRKKTPIVVGVLLTMILLVTFNLAPIVGASIVGVSLLFITRCISSKDGYKSVEWRILVLIYGMLALGMGMEKSGLTDIVAHQLISLGDLFISPALRPYVMLGCIYLCTDILTEVLSNNATVVLMTPLAIGLATTLGVDPRPFAIATCIASSASFSTPIGYQTNTYVYGVGGYKFKDFFIIGFPLNILFFIGCIIIIPQIWHF